MAPICFRFFLVIPLIPIQRDGSLTGVGVFIKWRWDLVDWRWAQLIGRNERGFKIADEAKILRNMTTNHLYLNWIFLQGSKVSSFRPFCSPSLPGFPWPNPVLCVSPISRA